MSDEPENHTLRLLRRIDTKLDDHARADVIERLGRIEREVANLHSDYVLIHGRLDRFDQRLQRIERRLDLIEIPEETP